MCGTNRASLLVSYDHIAKVQPLLAIWLTDVPQDMLQILDEVLRAVVKTEFPNYFDVSEQQRLVTTLSNYYRQIL
jgi:DNA replication licensing factor MCM2